MEVELEHLLLNKGELRRWVELDAIRYHTVAYAVILLTLMETPPMERKGELNASIQAFGDRAISPLLEALFNSLLFVIELSKLQNFLQQQVKYRSLVNLLRDVKNHNQVIYRIHVLDQLSSVGNQVGLVDRATVLNALKITKENLIQALKTQRILRQNPGFKPEHFAVDLASMRSLQVQEKSSEYGRLLNEALEIGVSLQQEIDQGFFQSPPTKNMKLD